MNDILTEDNLLSSFEPLKLADRCDKCGPSSQAFVRAVLVIDGKPHDLLFCGHHYNENEPTLAEGGWLIQDGRDSINHKPQSGSKYEDSDV